MKREEKMRKRTNKKFKALTDGMPLEYKKVIALCEWNYIMTDRMGLWWIFGTKQELANKIGIDVSKLMPLLTCMSEMKIIYPVKKHACNTYYVRLCDDIVLQLI